MVSEMMVSEIGFVHHTGVERREEAVAISFRQRHGEAVSAKLAGVLA
jgi:hypothetical protein